jgi:hypothetical protein
MAETGLIRTPDQRVRVFVSSALQELAAERRAVRDAVTGLRLVPVMFELGARPHPPRNVYRAYLAQSQVFVGIYWQSYGWVAPGERMSGLEDEYRLSAGMPRLIYVKSPAPDREARLAEMLSRIEADGDVSYRRFSDPEELQSLVQNDLAVLLSERFEMAHAGAGRAPGHPHRAGWSGQEPAGAGGRWPARIELRRWGAFRRPGPGSAGRPGGGGYRCRAWAEDLGRSADRRRQGVLASPAAGAAAGQLRAGDRGGTAGG